MPATYKPNWRQWHAAKFGSELLPIIPIDAVLSPTSKVQPANLGKVPGIRKKDGTWIGYAAKWADELFPKAPRLKMWRDWGAYIGMQGRKFNGGDVDVNDPKIAAAIVRIVVDICGATCIRFRDGSPRQLLVYRIEEGVVMRKWRIAFRDADGGEHAFEWLGFGQYFNVEGLHPSGVPYKWHQHPCDVGADKITVVTQKQVERVRNEIIAYLEMMGYEIMAQKSAGASNAEAKVLDNPKLHAPSTQMVFDALAVLKNTPENFPSHDDFVLVLRAIKASLGPDREQHCGKVLQWAMEYEPNTEDYFRGRWESIDDSTIGWDWLCARARGAGYHGDAQVDFTDDGSPPDAKGQENRPQPDAAIPETALERALNRYIWCGSLERPFYDTKTGQQLSLNAFNAANIGIADYGRSGVQSAAAILVNTEGAVKCDIATYHPGKPLTFEVPVKGGVATAMNLWRPSSFVPATNVSEDDVRLWLDHMELIFGPPESEALRHILNVLAFLTQKPGQKLNHAIVMYGATQGTGKDSCFVPLTRFYGDHNVSNIQPEAVTGTFTGFLCAMLCIINEMINFEKLATANRMKPWLAAPPKTITVNLKYAQPFDIPNVVNFIIHTNYADAIRMDDTDRRFWVHECLLTEPKPAAYYETLYAFYDQGGAEKVIGWLQQRDITNFKPHAPPPMTDAKRDMINLTMPKPVRYVRDLFVDGEMFGGRNVIAAREPLNAANQDFNAPPGINPKSVAKALRAEGFVNYDHHRIRIGGDVRQLWVRDPAGLLGKLSADQIRERYLSELRPNVEKAA